MFIEIKDHEHLPLIVNSEHIICVEPADAEPDETWLYLDYELPDAEVRPRNVIAVTEPSYAVLRSLLATAALRVQIDSHTLRESQRGHQDEPQGARTPSDGR